MAEWARVDDSAEPWKVRWEVAERRFFGHDVYRLQSWGSGATIQALARGESQPQETGKVKVTEREIRVGDAKFHAVVDVRRDRYSRWPREVLMHETEPLGTIRRSRGWGGRPSWDLVEAEGAVVATVRESSLGRAAGRRGFKLARNAATAVLTLGNSRYETSPRTDLVISGHTRQLGEIRDGSLLDLTGDPARELDRRLAVAAFVSILLAETGA